MSSQLNPAETRLQRDLLDQYVKAGDLMPETAARYRRDLVERGISIFDQPGFDGPNAGQTLERWRTVGHALARDGRLYRLRQRHETSAPRRVRGTARTPRRRTVRRTRAQARAPASKDPPEPPLEAVSLARFRRDVRRWREGVT